MRMFIEILDEINGKLDKILELLKVLAAPKYYYKHEEDDLK